MPELTPAATDCSKQCGCRRGGAVADGITQGAWVGGATSADVLEECSRSLRRAEVLTPGSCEGSDTQNPLWNSNITHYVKDKGLLERCRGDLQECSRN